jgi:hypothetical protein
MAIDTWKRAGAHGVRKYIWNLLQTELGWNSANYGGLVPITTPEQQPEFNNFDFPYIVYSYSRTSTSNLWVLESEVMALTVFAKDGGDIDAVVNLLGAKLNKRDETAKDVNKYIKASEASNSFYRNFDFKSFRVTGAQGPQAVTTEGGRRDGYVTISYTYTLYGSNGVAIHS